MTLCWIWPPLLRSVETDDLDIERRDKEKRIGLPGKYLAEYHYIRLLSYTYVYGKWLPYKKKIGQSSKQPRMTLGIESIELRYTIHSQILR